MMGILKRKAAIKLFKSYPQLKRKPYWGNHFWSRDTSSILVESIKTWFDIILSIRKIMTKKKTITVKSLTFWLIHFIYKSVWRLCLHSFIKSTCLAGGSLIQTIGALRLPGQLENPKRFKKQIHCWITRDPFTDFKVRFQKAEHGYLTENQIFILINKLFSLKRLEQVRDGFVFSIIGQVLCLLRPFLIFYCTLIYVERPF